MAKKHFLTLFSTFVLAFGWAYPSTYLFNKGNTILDTVECNEPAPDSFRVLSRGPNFVTLGWKTDEENTKYTLEVLVRPDSGFWEPFNIFTEITDGEITVNNIQFDSECRFILSANCKFGQTSVNKSIINDKIILDLEVGGRIPLNPQVADCSHLLLNKNNWIGFEVKHRIFSETIFNYFEFVYEPDASDGPTMHIKRTFDNTTVFATDPDYNYPPPKIKPGNPFRISQIQSPNLPDQIGEISAIMSFGAQVTVDLCPNLSNLPWNELYEFRALVAGSTVGIGAGSPSGHEFGHRPANTNAMPTKYYAVSPFHEMLIIFPFEEFQNDDVLQFKLFNRGGQIIREWTERQPAQQISVPMESNPPGIYFLQIGTSKDVQTLKLVKFN